MKLSKDQIKVVLSRVREIRDSKASAIDEERDEAIGGLAELGHVQFLRELSTSPDLAAAFCEGLADHLEQAIVKMSVDDRRSFVEAYDLCLPVFNGDDPDGSHSGGWYRAHGIPEFNCPKLAKLVAAREKQCNKINDKYDKRQDALDAKFKALELRLQLRDVPDDVIKIIDDFRNQKF